MQDKRVRASPASGQVSAILKSQPKKCSFGFRQKTVYSNLALVTIYRHSVKLYGTDTHIAGFGLGSNPDRQSNGHPDSRADGQ